MINIRFIFLGLLFLLHVNLNAGVDELLLELGQEGDLSQKTKQESLGHLKIYTRQDLERMHIRSLKDLIDFFPFTRYNEDNRGAATPLYKDFQPNNSHFLRLFLNDRELISPFYGNSLALYGRMNINYIDHIEIYTGAPSYKFGIEDATTIIRLYTKNPSREDTNLVGVFGGTYGTWETYGYSAHSYEDFSYLLHVNQREIERKNIYNNGSKLTRDMQNSSVFTQIKTKNHSFEFQGMQGEKDDFLGDSFAAVPKDNGVKYDIYSLGWFYDLDEKGIKASLDFTSTKYDFFEEAYDSIGFFKRDGAPFPMFYNSISYNVYEKLINAHVSKNIEFDNANLLFGVRTRYKNFGVKNLEVEKRKFGVTQNYDRDVILSGYTEGSYNFDENNILVASLKYENYHRNSFVENESSIGGRIGYIYNTNNLTFKTYFFIGEFIAEPYIIAENAAQGNRNYLSKETIMSVSAELGFKYGNHKTSIMLYYLNQDDMVYYDVLNSVYKNDNDEVIYHALRIDDVYQITSMDRLDTQLWISNVDFKSANEKSNYLGGYVRLLNSFGKWDLSNSLLFYGLDYATIDSDRPGYNYNVSLTYKHSRELSFFLKGSNLLGEALTRTYKRRNATISNVDIYDRTVWFGVEYQF